MTRALFAYSLLLMVSTASAGDHLLPIDPGMGSLSPKVDKAWLEVFNDNDAAFVRFDIRPAFNAATHLAVLGHVEIGKKGPFRLCYLKGSYAEETPVCAPIGDDFALSLASKVESIIRRDTYYSVTGDDGYPLDSTEYFFAANFVFAEVKYRVKGSVPDQLISAFVECAQLAQMKPGDPKRMAFMDKILKDLDAIQIPDSR